MHRHEIASAGMELVLVDLRAGSPLTAQQVAEKLDHPLAGAFDLLYRLRAAGVVEQLASGAWQLTEAGEQWLAQNEGRA